MRFDLPTAEEDSKKYHISLTDSGIVLLEVCYLMSWSCYVWIPKESGHDWERKIKGQKRIRLIAIDYCSATGTAGTRCRKNRGQSQPAGWSPEWTLVALQETQGWRS